MEQENDIMAAYTVVFDDLAYLGPGDAVTTANLVERLRPDLPSAPRVADFGCGVGASALVLAQSLPRAHVLALDLHAPFIARLASAIDALGLGERMSAVVGDMADPPPLEGVAGEFDLIWAESSIYSIGRNKAFSCWRPLLGPGGWLVFSDIVRQRGKVSQCDDVSAFWSSEYPDMTTADAIVDELSTAGFSTLRPVLAGRENWSNYYEPLRKRLQVLNKLENRPLALTDLLAELAREIDVFDRTADDVAIAYFLARRDAVD